MITLNNFLDQFSVYFNGNENTPPWTITRNISTIIQEQIKNLDRTEYTISDGIAIHKTAVIENGVTLKSPIIIHENCFIGAHAYLRGGVFLGPETSIGPSSEIKSSIILNNSSVAHFNFIGDSIIGSNVNFEAGSITANHLNEMVDKQISVLYNSQIINTQTDKFGSLVGDNSKIGANAVLSPGTILGKYSVVKRLELVEQIIEI